MLSMFALPTIFWMLPFACALDGNTPGNFKRMRRIRSFSGKQQNVQGHIKHISWERWKAERCNKAETRREVFRSEGGNEKRNHFSESRESSPFDLRTPHERGWRHTLVPGVGGDPSLGRLNIHVHVHVQVQVKVVQS